MGYETVWEPVTIIFISFSMGAFFGALWMFYSMYDSNKKIEEELDSKTRLLDAYEKHLDYEDDGYHAY
tara:strand:- start:1174 stop:1377 length:204 start_codon:yes stop_codon:yes gene_type:complete